MPNDSLKKLYVDELKDLYSAENQLVKALPKMAKAASSDYLRKGFEMHLEQTKGHVARLELMEPDTTNVSQRLHHLAQTALGPSW